MMVTVTLARQVAVLLIVLMMTPNSGEAKKKKMLVFNGKCYYTDGITRVYSQAVAECDKEGGKVVTFEDDAMVSTAANALYDLVGGNQFWIGMTGDSNGEWHWDGSSDNENNNPYWSMPRHNGGLDNCANARIVGEGQTMIYITQSCSVSVVTLCCKDDTTGCTGDPHFFISSSDADNTHLCFEVDGRDGDVLVLLQDSDLDLQVNGELFASKAEEFNKAFFSAIAVLCGDDEIIATKDHITINGVHIVDWDETYSVDLMNEGTVTSYDHSSARINLASDVQLEVTRSHTVNNETYLGFFITHAGALGDGATGVIGKFIGSKFTAFLAIESDSHGVVEFSELPITIPVHRVTRYSRSHREQIECWHYKVDSDAREDVLLGTREEYTADDLRYTPF